MILYLCICCSFVCCCSFCCSSVAVACPSFSIVFPSPVVCLSVFLLELPSFCMFGRVVADLLDVELKMNNNLCFLQRNCFCFAAKIFDLLFTAGSSGMILKLLRYLFILHLFIFVRVLFWLYSWFNFYFYSLYYLLCWLTASCLPFLFRRFSLGSSSNQRKVSAVNVELNYCGSDVEK